MNALKIISIVLKPFQIVVLVAGIGSVAYFTKEAHDQLTKDDDKKINGYDTGGLGRQEFYLYSTCVGMALTIFALVCALMGLLEKRYGAFAIMAIQAICLLQILVSTALIAKVLTTYEKKIGDGSICDLWDNAVRRDYEYTCGQLIGGVACGFIAVILFGVDVTISFASFTRSNEQI